MSKYILLTALLLTACGPGQDNSREGFSDWESAPREYICTPEQYEQVQKESKFCNDETSYLSTYCYGTAFMRNCTKGQRL